jgi:tetratricopeptide (TPR) repeat protein
MDAQQPSRYRILSPIGEGGMGSVSLAEDLELGRKVCLKFVSPSYAGDASARRRLIREATAAAHMARGELALAGGRADEAVSLLASANERIGSPEALEGLATALVAAGRLDEAARRYQDFIVDRPLGTEAQEYWFRAHLRLAEIRARQGDTDAARALYQEVLTLWKDGDQDLPALQEAKKRLEALG